jgi:phosphate starvation-inducible PhoH-like protein
MAKRFDDSPRKPRKNKYQRTPEDNGSAIKVRKFVKPRTQGQVEYLEALEDNTVVVASAPAGTGKTFLAIYHAVSRLCAGEVEKIILTRPAVEADEKLGFLPGTVEEKLAPYLIPMVDALEDLVGVSAAKKLLESRVVEVCPLAFMRGRTFNNACVVADEMQNATPSQVYMLLTRLGNNCSAAVNGDPAQCDLPKDKGNGIKWLVERLSRAKARGVAVIEMDESDIVRSEIVKILLPLIK